MFTGPLLLPPLLLLVLLLVSGAAKARHTDATRSAFSQLELPRVLTNSPAPRALPWVEILLAAALLVAPPPFALPVAVIATLLFAGYLVVIARALTFDHPVTCSCFGELGLGQVTRRTAVRNVLLVIVALLGVWSATAEASVASRLVDASGVEWMWLGLVVLTGAVLGTTFGGPKGGSPTSSVVGAHPSDAEGELDYLRQPLPFATLADADGSLHNLTELTRTGAVVLVFISPGCGSCRAAIESIPQWSTDLAPVRVIGVVAQTIEATVAAVPELEGHLMHDSKGVTIRIFGARTPSAVLLGGDGMLAGGPVMGGHEVTAFVEDVRGELLAAGVLAPA
ncbi:MauE/DoxX family redox-associated membrane protein [Janibacter cremeus]|uniref:Thiol-disulfide isomerase/thioredoxin n=1 Tax=Janibacter cremeus TaxID=1285192 RepID=A0A852VYR0_9MICO|nr:thiol-disulfide isomerase/thioredoxin [Janibacter cremeus]